MALSSSFHREVSEKGQAVQNGPVITPMITWQDAEDTLLEAVELLGRMPDRERGFLCAGAKSSMPEFIRDAQADYADAEARPRTGLTRAEVALVGRVLLDVDAHVLAVPAGKRALLGRVLVAKLDGRGEGFRWERIWEWDDRRRRAAGDRRVTLDAVRRAYERAVGRVAVAMEKAARRGAVMVARAA